MQRRAADGMIRVRKTTATNGGTPLTLIWFIVWLICDLVGDRESLTFDPVNWWAGTLILAIALDLSRQHASMVGKRG